MAALAGGGIAAFLTYMFAPKSWNKFTREITKAARSGWNQIETYADDIGDEAETLYNEAGTEAQTLYTEARPEAQKLYNEAGTEAQKIYGDAKTEAGAIGSAAQKDINSFNSAAQKDYSAAQTAVAGFQKDAQDEKARLAAGFDAGKKAYDASGNSSQKTAGKAN